MAPRPTFSAASLAAFFPNPLPPRPPLLNIAAIKTAFKNVSKCPENSSNVFAASSPRVPSIHSLELSFAPITPEITVANPLSNFPLTSINPSPTLANPLRKGIMIGPNSIILRTIQPNPTFKRKFPIPNPGTLGRFNFPFFPSLSLSSSFSTFSSPFSLFSFLSLFFSSVNLFFSSARVPFNKLPTFSSFSLITLSSSPIPVLSPPIFPIFAIFAILILIDFFTSPPPDDGNNF